MNPILRGMLSAVRRAGLYTSYADLDGTEIVPIFSANGSKHLGNIALSTLLQGQDENVIAAGCRGAPFDDTAAIEAAIALAKAAGGGTVLIDKPIVMCNITLTGKGFRIRHRAADLFSTPDAYIGPYDALLPAIKIGDGTTETHSIYLDDINLFAASGDKQGLVINGAHHIFIDKFGSRGFEEHSLKVTSSATRESTYIFINGFNIEPGDVANAFGAKIDYGSNYTTAVFFSNGEFHKSGANHDHVVQVSGTGVSCFMTNCWVEGGNLQGVEFANTGSYITCSNVIVDSGSNAHILLELPGNEPVSNYMRGTVTIDGCVKTPAATSSALTGQMHLPYQTVIDTPHITGSGVRFHAPGTTPASRYSTTDPTVMITRVGTGSNLQYQANNSHFYQTDGATNAPILVRYVRLVDGITAPGAVAGEISLFGNTADGDLTARFGDGFTASVQADS